jgi:hypothetical protein
MLTAAGMLGMAACKPTAPNSDVRQQPQRAVNFAKLPELLRQQAKK